MHNYKIGINMCKNKIQNRRQTVSIQCYGCHLVPTIIILTFSLNDLSWIIDKLSIIQDRQIDKIDPLSRTAPTANTFTFSLNSSLRYKHSQVSWMNTTNQPKWSSEWCVLIYHNSVYMCGQKIISPRMMLQFLEKYCNIFWKLHQSLCQ